MTTTIGGILSVVAETPWLVEPQRLRAMLAWLEHRAVAGSGTYVAASRGARYRPARAGGQIAIVPLHGLVAYRSGLVTSLFGGTATEVLATQIETAVAEPSIAAVVLEIDSPGGSVDGVPELASKLYGLRGQKPLVAVCNTLNASAAYWISSACDEMVATPSAQVGSIGVFMVRVDTSAADERAGLKYTVIKAGKYKAEDVPFEPITDDEEAACQQNVNDLYAMFTTAVAQHRGVSPAAVRNGYGQGRVLNARKALAAGLVDRVATLDQVVSELASGRRRVSQPRARAAAIAAQAVEARSTCGFCGASRDGGSRCSYCGR